MGKTQELRLGSLRLSALTFPRVTGPADKRRAFFAAALGIRGGVEARPIGRGQDQSKDDTDLSGTGQNHLGGVRRRRQAGQHRPAVPCLPRTGRADRWQAETQLTGTAVVRSACVIVGNAERDEAPP